MTGEDPQNKKNIIFLINDMQGGGSQRVASLLCNAWAGQGHTVTMMTYEPRDAALFYPIDDVVSVKALDLEPEKSGNWNAFVTNFKRVLAVSKVLKDDKPDVLICFGCEATVIGVLSAMGLDDIKVIGCERTDPSLYPTGIWHKLRNFTYPRADRLIVQTHTAAAYCSRLNNSVYIIPNPIVKPDPTGEADIIGPERPFIASMGRMTDDKGHDILIEAFALVAEKNKDIDLLLIGDGVNRPEYEVMAKKMGIDSRVHFAGRSLNPFPVLAQAKVFILPSRVEGFPNSLAEAMALGLPCIATLEAVGGKAIIDQGRNGILIEGENPKAMAHTITEMLDNREYAEKLGAEAAKIGDILSLDNNLDFWNQAISN